MTPRVCIDRPRRRLPMPPGVEEMAVERLNVWTPGQTLRIAFHGGRRADRAAIVRAAYIWMEHANIRIVAGVSGPAEIRCSFEPGGSWSLVGTDCLPRTGDPARDELIMRTGPPTMNMGWPNDPARDLHELGHALGCIHEHQSPAAGIQWNRIACDAFFGAPPNDWSPAEVQQQVIDRYSQATITNSVYDPYSIMHYWFPPQLLLVPLPISGPNQALSAQDIAFIGSLYPRK